MMIGFVVMMLYPEREYTKKSQECLQKLKVINIYLLIVWIIKWIACTYRLSVFCRGKKQTSTQVERLRNEITRSIHGEQKGINMLFIIALIFSMFSFFSIDEA